MMSLWDALRMNMMISYQELVRTFPILAGIIQHSYPTHIPVFDGTVQCLKQSFPGKAQPHYFRYLHNRLSGTKIKVNLIKRLSLT